MNKARLRQYFVAFSCQMSAMMVGSCFVWFTPLLEGLTTESSRIPMTTDQSSWMIALIEIGELFSPIPAGMLVNRFGRKTVLLTSFPLTACSWVLLLSSDSVASLFIVRFLQGMAMGVVFTVAPIYLAEIAEPEIRGALCGNFQTMWTLGILYAYVTGPFLTYEAYAYANAFLALVFVTTYLWAPESPYFLLMRGRQRKAQESLAYLRATPDVEEELKSIKNSLKAYDSDKNARWSDLVATKKDRRTLLVVSAVCFVKYMSGIAAITTYLTKTLSQSAAGTLDKDFITIATGVVMLLATLVSAFVSDAVGRRPLLLMSTAGSILFNVIAGVYFLLVQLKTPNIGDYSWVAYSSIGIYCIISNIGLSPLLQTLQAECFSSENRGIGGAFISFIGTIFIFLSLKQYQPVHDWVGVYMNYFSFSIYSLLGSLLIFPFLKETAGKSLGEIQENKDTLLNKDTIPP